MQKLPRGELPPGHEGGGHALPPWAHPPASWAHGGPPPLILAPIFFLCLTQTRKTTQARVPAPVAVIFDLLAQSTFRKTVWGGIVPWYVTPPLVQLVFVLVLYSLQICAA